MYVWLLGYLTILHYWCTLLAELTYFADRKFYEDWWNSDSFRTYWRRWNIPMYNFLKRHVMKPMTYTLTERFKLNPKHNRTFANSWTIFLSAIGHEYMVRFLCI